MFVARDDRQIRSFTGRLPGKLIRDMLARYRTLARDDRYTAGDVPGLFAVYGTVAELEDDFYGLYDDRGELLGFENIEVADLPCPYLVAKRRSRCGPALICYVPAEIAPRELVQGYARDAC